MDGSENTIVKGLAYFPAEYLISKLIGPLVIKLHKRWLTFINMVQALTVIVMIN